MTSSFVRLWRNAISVLVCLIAVAGFHSALHAQTTLGSLQGTVLDARGHAVQGASVAIANADKVVRIIISAADGKFSASGLSAGTYSVETSATGFATAVRRIVVDAGQTANVSVSLVLASVSEEVTVEAEGNTSIAAQLAPVKALLDTGSARNEITSQYIREFTSPVTDFSDIVQAAPGTVSYSNNGVGLGQAKIFFRGFVDDDYTMTWDGVPFEDANDPSHHSWAYVPAPAISYVDFDRSPGTASDFGPSNFGGSIHMFSPQLSDNMWARASESYGSFNTNEYLGEFSSGLFGGANPKNKLWFEGHHMTSDGYLTGNDQQRTAGTLKYNHKFSEQTNATLIGTVVLVDSNTPDSNSATRAQIAQFGDNYLLDKTKFTSGGAYDPMYYRYYTYHVPTNFEIATLNNDFGHGWRAESKLYTYSYSNHQHYNNYFGSDFGPNQAKIGTDGVNKMNQYSRIGGMSSVSQASRYGVFRFGGWYEWTTVNRYQVKSNPLTWVDSASIKDLNFHENFWIKSFQPFAEYQLVAIPRWTITVGLKDAYYNMRLKQFADSGKKVGPLCPPGVTTGCPAYVIHDAGYNNWLPSLEANSRIMSAWSVYGDYGRGSIVPFSSVFDVQGAQVAATPPPNVASTYQGGTVVKLNHVSMDADVYHIHFSNPYSSYQVPQGQPDAGFTFYYANPPSNTTGVEGEANVALTRGVSVFLNGTYGEAKYEASSGTAATSTAPAVPASPSVWVANTPRDTETVGGTFQNKAWDLGFFDKRVGTRWDDVGAFHQNINYDPFWVGNLFLNYTLRNGSFFDQSKLKLSFNNIMDNHNVVSISAANAGAVTQSGQIFTPDPGDALTLLPGRSVMVTFQIGLSPRR